MFWLVFKSVGKNVKKLLKFNFFLLELGIMIDLELFFVLVVFILFDKLNILMRLVLNFLFVFGL